MLQRRRKNRDGGGISSRKVYTNNSTDATFIGSCDKTSFTPSQMSIFSPWPIRRFLSGHPEQLRCFQRALHSNSPRLQATNDIKDNAKEKKEKPLPPLNRPLGVRQRPTTVARTTREMLGSLMDQDARMAERRHLYVRLRCLTTIFQIDL